MPELLDTESTKTDQTKTDQTNTSDTESTGWLSPTGEIKEGAPESVMNIVKNKGWDTVEKIVDGFIGLEKFKGVGEHLVIPETEDDVEGWDKVFNLLGRPETSDKYEFSYEGDVKVSDELLDSFKQFAHKEGYTQKQLAGAVNFQLDAVAAANELFETQKAEQEEKNIQAMKKKWGESNYDSVFKGIETTAEKLGILKFLRSHGIDKEPEIVNMLLTITNSDTEDEITDSDTTTAEKTPQERLAEIMKSDAFNHKFDKDHKKIMVEYMQLNQTIANAGQGQAPRA